MDERAAHLAKLGLREEPFAPTADPAYFYASEAHRECLFRLWSSIDARYGVAVVLGSYGSGKTTILRKIIAGMAAEPEKYLFGVIGSPIPSWTSFALLEQIVAAFEITPEENTFASYLQALNRRLLAHRNRIATLIIDDAQNLTRRGQLELLRLVQNLETPQHKLLNLVCFAQSEWLHVLQAAPNFQQRIGTVCTLKSVTYEEMEDFVRFRLRQASDPAGPSFSETALRSVYEWSEGTPRAIVNLCRNALIEAARAGRRQVTHEMVLAAIDHTALPDPDRRARVVMAIQEARRRAAGPGVATDPRSVREKRAAELLLRGVQKQPREDAP